MTARTSLFRCWRNACAVLSALLPFSFYEPPCFAESAEPTFAECDSQILVTKDRAQQLGCGACKPISKRSGDGSMIFANQTVRIKPDKKGLSLVEGKIVIFSGKVGMELTANTFRIETSPNSCCLIDVPTKDILRVANFKGRAISIIFPEIRRQCYTIESGEDIWILVGATQYGCVQSKGKVGDKNVSLDPQDGVGREYITVCMGVPNYVIAKNKFETLTMLQNEPLFNCQNSSSMKAKSKVAALRRSIQNDPNSTFK